MIYMKNSENRFRPFNQPQHKSFSPVFDERFVKKLSNDAEHAQVRKSLSTTQTL